MPASIHTLLADELDISEPMAEKLLSAMLREVRKRAAQGGVRLPDLGKFKVEDGELTFHPADGLARAVNHRFEGLQSEDLRGAPEPDSGEEQDPEGPSTITLGYQDSSGWSPLDAEDESEAKPETAGDESDEEESADTEEFEMPTAGASPDEANGEPSAPEPPRSAEETSPERDADRTGSKEPSASAESDVPGDTREPEDEASSPEPTSASADAEETPDTEELYPLVDDMSDEPSEGDAADLESEAASGASPDSSESAATTSETNEERDELSKIWGSEEEEDTDDETAAFSAESDLDEETTPDTGDTALDDIPTDPDTPTDADEPTLSETDHEDETTTPESTETESTETEPTPQPSRPSKSGSSTLPRVLVTLLVLVLLGGGAWYILGQRGLVPSPGQTVSQLSGTSADAGPDQQAAGPASSSADGTSEQDAPSSSEVSEDASDEPAAPSSDASSAAGIDPAAGGWTIVVASRADRDAATALVDTYRQRFEGQGLPVDVLQGTVDNTTRYRVSVGQFASRSEAQSFLDDNSDALPSGAWPLDLQ